MALLLLAAALGAVIRGMAPDPSITRDVGTLMLVLWLPAIGNLIAYLSKKLPRGSSPPTRFSPDVPFSADIEVNLQRLALPVALARPIPTDQLATVLVGRRGFSVRFAISIEDWLAGDGDATMALELLRPSAALAHLQDGTRFHLLSGPLPVAKGVVLQHCR